MKVVMTALLLVCVLAPVSFAREKKEGPGDAKSDPAMGVNFYSIEKEIALGKQMAEDWNTNLSSIEGKFDRP